MENALIIVAYAGVVIFSFIPVIKKKQPGEISAYSLLLLLAISLYVLKTFIKPDLKPLLVLITDLLSKIMNVK